MLQQSEKEQQWIFVKDKDQKLWPVLATNVFHSPRRSSAVDNLVQSYDTSHGKVFKYFTLFDDVMFDVIMFDVALFDVVLSDAVLFDVDSFDVT